jgi:hypothetical protein
MGERSAVARVETVEVAPLTLLAALQSPSINVEARTVDVVFYAGAALETCDWATYERCQITLSLKPSAVRLDRLNNGAPFLNAHNSYDLDDVIGVIEPGSAQIAKGRGVATVRFSKRDDVEPIWQDVQDGIIRNVSVGARIYKYEQTEATDSTPMTRLATDWEPFEISAVPIGADPGAQIKATDNLQKNTCVVVHAKEPNMGDENRDQATPTATIPAETRSGAAAESRDRVADVAAAQRHEGQSDPTDRDAGIVAERIRCEGIIRAVRSARFGQEFADQLIRDGVALLDAQGQVLARLALQDDVGPSQIPAGTGARVLQERDGNVAVRAGIVNAIMNRAAPDKYKLDEHGKQYRGLTLIECARECLRRSGARVDGLSPMELAARSLGLDTVRGAGGYHTTSDFPNIVADVANKMLRRAYEETPQTFTQFSRRMSVSDFKTIKELQLGEAPMLEKVLEHGEYHRGTMAESKEEFSLETYGIIFAITRKTLVNDDTNAFSRMSLLFARSARNLESNIVWTQIISNPTMGDGVALFHATHKNLSGTSDAISVTSIGAGRAAMRVQTGLDGVTLINANPAYLISPAAKETLADQFVSTNLVAAQTSNVNPFAGRLQVIAEPRLDAVSTTAWYLVATPDQIDTVVYAYLTGEEGPTIETRLGFDVDGMEMKCRHDFAAKVLDWRGFYKNNGA